MADRPMRAKAAEAELDRIKAHKRGCVSQQAVAAIRRGHRADYRCLCQCLVPARSAAGAFSPAALRRKSAAQWRKHGESPGPASRSMAPSRPSSSRAARRCSGACATSSATHAQKRLQSGHLRRLHGADRWRAAVFLPDACRELRGRDMSTTSRALREMASCIRCSTPSWTVLPRNAASARPA